jgi:SAM-dependent methyltransferase
LTTAYDRVAYPSAIFTRTHPDRLAVIATLHGLAPPDVRTARVLEIGCGDGLNACALAAAYPDAQFEGFDLSEVAIRRGQELIALSGLTNIVLTVLDATIAAAQYPAGSFDYVIAHGIYAWVPEPVRAAILALIGHVLASDGVALVSYNALPGGHVRMVMRDMLLLQTEGITDADEKIAVTRRFLESLDLEIPENETLRIAVREQARSMLKRPDGVLFHDELGEVYAPQSLMDVASAAAAVGLRVLSDSGRNRQLDGFFPEDHVSGGDPERELLRLRQIDDQLSMRFFRHSLFVRSEAAPLRRIDTSRLDALWISARLRRGEDGIFCSGEDQITVKDAELASTLERLSEAWPDRLPVKDLIKGEDRRMAVLDLFSQSYAELHWAPKPFTHDLSDRPRTSALIRGQIERGDTRICALNHVLLSIDQPELRHLLDLADGTRTIAEICATPGLAIPPDEVPLALTAAARRALIIA